jgi:sigma-B regulation protein RsbU (phosphoserine phosphatase)
VLGVPPLFLIWYSYDVYAGRLRDRATFSSEVASFREEIAAAVRSQDELRDAQRRVAAEIERARGIQADLLPRQAPEVPGLELAHRIEFMTEMGGDYFDFVPLSDGRLGLVCGDVMGKGLAAALIMTMARSLILSAARDGHRPSEVLCEVNDALTRDLAGQSAPSFLTLAYAIYSPADRELVVANGGHNPLLVFGSGGLREFPSRGSMLGVRADLEFPEDRLVLELGDTFALFTDGLTEARDGSRALFGTTRLAAALERAAGTAAAEKLESTWQAVADFRAGAPLTDDATLLLGHVVAIEDH